MQNWSKRRCADGVETAVGHYRSEQRCADGFVEQPKATIFDIFLCFFSFLAAVVKTQ